jgi:hypothetical protein
MRVCGFLLLVAAGLSTACIIGESSRRPRKPGELDFKLDTFTYLEEGKIVALAVGTEATRWREKEAYIPLAICIANKGGSTLKITRESFTLQDENGKRYSAIPVSELTAGYGPDELDRNFTGTFSVFFSRFPTYDLVRSNFYPGRSSPGLAIDRVEIPRSNRISDWLYFPKPETGVVGRRFELHMQCQGLKEGVFVKFLVD